MNIFHGTKIKIWAGLAVRRKIGSTQQFFFAFNAICYGFFHKNTA
jgi:hypothetical protein